MILKNERAMMLIITLWVLAILSLLALGLSFRMSIEMKSVRFQVYGLKALYAAKAGYQRVLTELQDPINAQAVSINQSWGNREELYKQIALGQDVSFDASYTFSYDGKEQRVFYGAQDEASRININTATYETLVRLPGMTSEAAASIVDWRDADDASQPMGAENAYYESLQPGYACKNGPFQSIEEALLVKGMTSEIFYGIKDYITVFTDGKVNINTATKPVLMALGINESLADGIVSLRNGYDGILGTSDDLVFTDPAAIVPKLQDTYRISNEDAAFITNLISTNNLGASSDVFRICARGTVTSGVVSKDITLVYKRTVKDGNNILFWHRE